MIRTGYIYVYRYIYMIYECIGLTNRQKQRVRTLYSLSKYCTYSTYIPTVHEVVISLSEASSHDGSI